MRGVVGIEITPIGGDLLAFAQCCALDASVFPHSSLPTDATTSVFVARAAAHGEASPSRPQDRRVLGFVATRMHANRLEITGLAVDPSARRRGLGAALLAHAEEEADARDLRELVLHVAVDNANAIGVYDRAGFNIVRLLRNHYRHIGTHAYEMVKRVGA